MEVEDQAQQQQQQQQQQQEEAQDAAGHLFEYGTFAQVWAPAPRQPAPAEGGLDQGAAANGAGCPGGVPCAAQQPLPVCCAQLRSAAPWWCLGGPLSTAGAAVAGAALGAPGQR
jgi:hypothetical protein